MSYGDGRDANQIAHHIGSAGNIEEQVALGEGCGLGNVSQVADENAIDETIDAHVFY